MFFNRVAEDENIIKIHYNASIKQLKEDIIHNTLESARSITKSKRHNFPVKSPIPATKGSFLLVF